MCRVVLVSTFVYAIALASAGRSDDVFRIRNTSKERDVWVWLMPEQRPRQWAPQVFVGADSARPVLVASPGRHFIVFRDDQRHERPIGWRDLRKMTGSGQSVELSLESLYHFEERTTAETVTEMVPETRVRTEQVREFVPEQRTREVRYWDRAQRRWLYRTETYTVWRAVWKTVERQYTVNVLQSRVVERRYTVSVFNPKCVVVVDGVRYPLDEIMPEEEVR